MNRRPTGLAVALLAVLAAAVVPAVSEVGVVGLVRGLALNYPLGLGQIRALVLTAAGLGLLLLIHLLDRQAIARTLAGGHAAIEGSADAPPDCRQLAESQR